VPLRRSLHALLVAGIVAALLGAGPVAAAEDPALEPSPTPTAEPQPDPSPSPEPPPTAKPTSEPTVQPTADPTAAPTDVPSAAPTADPSPGASPTATPSASGVVPAWAGRFNLYRSTAWVRQYRNFTCTAASAQTMINIIRGRSDRSLLLQLRIIKYARAHDYLRTSAGSDPAGWARAVTAFGGGAYTWKTFTARSTALRYAAKRMLVTGKPVGLLVWRGRHAWTMTGFTSATDPRTDPLATITGVFVAPPLVGVDPKPNSYLTVAALGTFAKYAERDGLRALVGRWVVVAP
jgi:hypothetical protein